MFQSTLENQNTRVLQLSFFLQAADETTMQEEKNLVLWTSRVGLMRVNDIFLFLFEVAKPNQTYLNLTVGRSPC